MVNVTVVQAPGQHGLRAPREHSLYTRAASWAQAHAVGEETQCTFKINRDAVHCSNASQPDNNHHLDIHVTNSRA